MASAVQADTTFDQRTRADQWLTTFAAAFSSCDEPALTALFDAEGSWRDMLAVTGDLRTAAGVDQILDRVRQAHVGAGVDKLTVLEVTSAELNERTGVPAIEAVFTFETGLGRCRGVVRLLQEDESSPGRAWTLLTALDSLDADRVRQRPVNPSELPYETVDRRNWQDFRTEQVEYVDREPEVLVVGAGHSGLALAARLRDAGVDTLVVDRNQRVGDNWRNRYHMLRLHNQVGANHLPFMPFPSNWPVYIPKDKLADWFESYAHSMEINVWMATTLEGATYDAAARRWTAQVVRNGVSRTLYPQHLVMAIGVNGTPRLPAIPGLDDFAGTKIHSSQYNDGSAFRDKSVLVVGSGVSGHDIAQDLHYHGAHVTLMQRSKTIVASLAPGAEKVYALYRSNEALSHLDLINVSIPYPVKRARAEVMTATIRELDAELIDGLEAAGFRTHTGSDGTGFQMQFLRHGGGYYIDVGCSTLIASGKVRVLPAGDLARITADGVQLTDGTETAFDAIVLATGYQSLVDNVAELLGRDVAEQVGPVWGLDDEGELRNVCRPTTHPGLWFIAGGLAEGRIFSTYLALAITADLSGIDLPRQQP